MCVWKSRKMLTTNFSTVMGGEYVYGPMHSKSMSVNITCYN